MGLGAAADISLAKARYLASAARQLLVEGIDPLEDRREQEAAVVEAAREAKLEETGPLLFGPFADTYIDTHEEAWRNLKHRQQWRNSIRTHANALLKKPIGEIMVNDVVAVLMPIWRSTPETAGRLRRSEEHTSELQSLMRTSYAGFGLKKKKNN